MATTSKDDGDMQSLPGPIPSAISAALESNLALQAELRQRLLKIRCKKVQNRLDAARVAASMSQCWNGEDHSGEKLPDKNNEDTFEPPTKKMRGDFADKLGDEISETSIIEAGEKAVPDNNEEAHKSKNDDDMQGTSKSVPQSPKDIHIKRAHNPKQRITRGFFVDSDGSTPEILRSNFGTEIESDMSVPSTRIIFERKQSRVKLKGPQKSWQKIKKKNLPLASLDEVSLKTESTSPNEAGDRTVACLSFADPKIAKAKFTKQECLLIMSMVRKMVGNQQRDIDWYELAMKHYAKFKRQTPWLCFSHYRSTLQNPSTRVPPWSSAEDELLLKYLAAQGPQYLLQGESIMQTTRNLFPLRNTKQIALRAQSTLMNPNYVHDTWSQDEKRKLALLMRVYSNEKNPINFASRAVHFPDRAPKNVGERWIKTLDPALSFRPFTAEEDKKLQDRPSGGIGVKFPHRSDESLKRRWAELADEHDVAAHCERKLISKAFKKGGLGSKKSSLSPKDFKVLPHSKRSR